MQELIEQLNEPDIHFPGNFDTPKQANALLMCLCQEAAEAIKAQSAEIAVLKIAHEAHQTSNLKMLAILKRQAFDLLKHRSLCDQLHDALEEAMYANSTEVSSDKSAKALEAWKSIK